MTIEEIRDLINLASETGIAELEVQRGDTRVRIRRGLIAPAAQEIVLTQPAAVPAATKAPTRPASPATDGEPPLDPAVSLVKAPIVGTFYESPSPDAPPFVRVGERVQPGKVLCIIESMKLMNEIEAETSGIIESRLVINGQPVEYGEALFAIRAV
jgi:acetyl-CoA carboxylase biotin carboxyl carrier protein